MIKSTAERELAKEIFARGQDVILHENTELMKSCIQHGITSVFEHTVSVAKFSLIMAHSLEKRFGMKFDYDSLVRGALLHDYFLYDWHVKGPQGNWHGYTHPKAAYLNASRDFKINSLEKDIIMKHMFPLTINPPRHRESLLICLADKYCALCETFKVDVISYTVYRINYKIGMHAGKYKAGAD